MEIRLQKYLSERGILSRRKAEKAIIKGQILVNGVVVTELGTKVDPHVDHVTLHPSLQEEQSKTVTIMFNKPRGIWSNCAQQGEKEIIDLLPDTLGSLHTIGRLDKDSEGLILLTNNGVVANKYLNSGEQHEKKYLVWLSKPISGQDIQELEQGIDIGGYITKPCTIRQYSEKYVMVILTEGKNRQLRKMFRGVHNTVVRLKRVQFGPYTLEDLPVGEFKYIS